MTRRPKAAGRPASRKPAWTVYILRCADGTLYTGIAMDAAKRLLEHNTDNRLGARYTRSRRPVVLAYREPAATRATAARREYVSIRPAPLRTDLAVS